MTALDIARRLYAAFAAGDLPALGALLGDTQWEEAHGGPYGGSYRGIEQIAGNVFGPIQADVRDFTATPDELVAVADDRVLALGHYRGTTEAGPLAIRFAHLLTVAGDRISHFEQFTDTQRWHAALGR